MSAALDMTRKIVAAHLDEIKQLFKPWAKITVLVRRPDTDGRYDFLMSDDGLDEVVAAVQRLMTRPTLQSDEPSPPGQNERNGGKP